jgi:hypothetical protein
LAQQENPGGKGRQHFTISVGITRSGTVRSGITARPNAPPDAYQTSGSDHNRPDDDALVNGFAVFIGDTAHGGMRQTNYSEAD